MDLVMDHKDIEESIERQCDNLREFKRKRLKQMENSFNTNRRRRSIEELYSSDVEEIAKLVLRTIDNYIKVDEMAEKTAQEKALADYMFWYNNDEDKRRRLESIVYNQ
ncbi:hypothetical protein [Litchfieldia alkalitelluris]|uniref:hypothetical protein n=1 Tax=Litchfieldia alkalitelluris TaxID=304268 RepID=UPI0009972033|nr:hypothetical protein [Litchfieldia alkalitelluris]